MWALAPMWARAMYIVLTFSTCASMGDWREDMHDVMRRCSAYAQLKQDGLVSKDELEKAKLATRQAIRSFVMETERFDNVAEFRQAVSPPGGPGKALERASEFVQTCFAIGLRELRDSWGHMMEKRAWTESCRGEARTKSHLEGQCFPSNLGIALNMFQWSGEMGELQRAFEAGRTVFTRWQNPMFRPKIVIPDVRDLPVWTRADDGGVAQMMELLEKNIVVFKEDLQVLKAGGHFDAAFDTLVGQGSWSKASLFEFAAKDGPSWNKRCEVVPRSCDVFRDVLPQRKQIPRVVGNQEEVVFFYGSPHSHVLPHTGGQNARINIHIGLEGYEGSTLNVFTDLNETQTLLWSDDRAVAFNDGWAHEVVNGPGHRYVLAVGYMHPDIEEAHFAEAFNMRTQLMKMPKGRMKRFQNAYIRKYGKAWEHETPRLARTEL